MKITQVLILLLLCLDFQSVNANSTYDWGDTLHVWATSGLNMREGPGTNFPKMKKLEYGDKVQVIDGYLRSTPLNITVVKKSEKCDAFAIKGHWVKVKIGKRKGYAFDGYLSRLPVIKFIKNKEGKVTSEGFYRYADREFGLKLHEDIDNPAMAFQERFLFNNNMEIESISYECYSMSINLGKITFNEAYLFFNHIGNFENKLKNGNPRYQNELNKIEWKKGKGDKHSISYSHDGGGISLRWKNGNYIYEYGSCC